MRGVALITGGQSGIGFGVATTLKKAGFKVALAADAASDDPHVQQALSVLGDGVSYDQHDLRDVSAVDGLLDRVEVAHGPVTTLISNAGMPSPVRGDMLDLSPEDLDTVLNVNLSGGYFLAQAVAKRMLAHEVKAYQSMVFVTSVSAEMVSVDRADYCMSKAAASMMARLFAVRLAPQDIGVFELRPGIIETPMTEGVREKYDARISDGLVPGNRWGRPEDVASIILPLVTGQARFSTGAVIPVDGALSVPRL